MGALTWPQYLAQYMVPTLIGNTLGGVLLVAVANHAQARGGKEELSEAVQVESRGMPTEHRQRSAPIHRGLTLAALGVVFGDIGTSPLYALRECFHPSHGVSPTPANILGVLSLVFWSLVIVISLKYLAFVMRADNRGEGGTLALMALIPGQYRGPSSRALLIALGLFATSMLYGDGMITPAITVLGAMEGLNEATPIFTPYVVPLSLVVLAGLFMVQSRGTAAVGKMFGPVMVVWFATIALLGVTGLVLEPVVLGAVNPMYALRFFADHGVRSVVVLGSVFLVVTGGEALYADMGHFGKRPIRLAWFLIAQPALMLNYFGQGALMLADPSAAESPFYRLAPAWALLPLIGLATCAAVIASQALISAVFSLTRNAVQLGYCPRMKIEFTSATQMGQVYVGSINYALMISTMALVVGFGSSTRLAAAYGIAVTLTMTITTILAYVIARQVWGWGRVVAGPLAAFLLVVDLAFVTGNAMKIFHGGWVALGIALLVFTLLATWKTGRNVLAERLRERAYPLSKLLVQLERHPPLRVPGTAVFMSGSSEGAPPPLLHNLEYNKVMHEQVILLTVRTTEAPQVPPEKRARVERLGDRFFRVTLDYGFMEQPDVPLALGSLPIDTGLVVNVSATAFFLGRETLLATARPGMWMWRERLFAFMSRNAQRATTFFKIPPERVVEIGIQVEL